MLDILRKKSGTVAVYFVFAILIVIFAVGFGAVAPDQACGGTQPGQFKNRALVEVDGEEIDGVLLRSAMALSGNAADPRRGFPSPEARRDYQMRLPMMYLVGPFSGASYGVDTELQSPIKMLKVTDELIETKLVSSYARQLGLGVSKEELNAGLAFILTSAMFKDPQTGAFEINLYRNWVDRQAENTVGGFEKMVEDELLREKVIQLLVGEIGVSEADIAQAHKLENDKVVVDYIGVDERSAATLVPVTDAEVAEWLGKNEDKVKAEYEAQKATRYTTAKTWKLRGIKVSAPAKDNSPEMKESVDQARMEAKAKADKILAEVTALLTEKKVPEVPEGEPQPVFDPIAAFAGVATAQSEDEASKAAGGALPEVTLAELTEQYGAAAAAGGLTVGQVSAVFEAEDGFWILLPEAITDEKVQSYEEVKNAIAKRNAQTDKVKPFVKTLADEVLAEAKKDPSKKLEEIALVVNKKYGADTGLRTSQLTFSRLSRLGQGYPASSPFLMELGGRAPDLVFAAFAASAEKPLLDKVFSVGDSGKLVIARFAELKAAEAATDEQKNEIRSQLQFERRRAVYRGWYEDLLAKKRASGDIDFTSAFEDDRRLAEEAFVQAGGELPGVKPPAPAAPPVLAPAPAP